MSDECMFGPGKSPKLVSKQSATFAGTTEFRDLPGLVVPLEISNLPLKRRSSRLCVIPRLASRKKGIGNITASDDATITRRVSRQPHLFRPSVHLPKSTVWHSLLVIPTCRSSSPPAHTPPPRHVPLPHHPFTPDNLPAPLRTRMTLPTLPHHPQSGHHD